MLSHLSFTVQCLLSCPFYISHICHPISQLRQFLFLGLWKHWWPLKEDSTESKNAYQHRLATHPIPWLYFYRRCDSVTNFWTTGQDHLEIIQKCVLSKFDFWHMIPYWVTVSKKKKTNKLPQNQISWTIFWFWNFWNLTDVFKQSHFGSHFGQLFLGQTPYREDKSLSSLETTRPIETHISSSVNELWFFKKKFSNKTYLVNLVGVSGTFVLDEVLIDDVLLFTLLFYKIKSYTLCCLSLTLNNVWIRIIYNSDQNWTWNHQQSAYIVRLWFMSLPFLFRLILKIITTELKPRGNNGRSDTGISLRYCIGGKWEKSKSAKNTEICLVLAE